MVSLTPMALRPLVAMTVLCVALALFARQLTAQVPDFSGTWRLDAESSTITPPPFLNERGGASANSLYITQAENGTLTIGTETNGAQAWAYHIGRESRIPSAAGTTISVVTRWDSGRLVVEDVESAGAALREVLALSADGETLRIEVTARTADTTTTNTLVYTRGRSVGPCEEWETPCVR